MSRVIVVGGHGRTGRLIIEKLLAKGETPVATIRNPKHMTELVKLGVEVVMLDLDKSPLADIEQAFTGADAVVFAAASAEKEPSTIDRKGVQRTVLAAEKAGVKRYLAISALGDSTPIPPEFQAGEMKSYYAAKRAASKRIRASRLEWTILEPGELGDDRGTGKVKLSTTGAENKMVARADVAAVVVALLAEPNSIGKTFQLVGGSTAVSTAVKKAAAG